MNEGVVVWERNVEVPPREEQVGNVRWYPDCALMIRKELVVEGSSIVTWDQ